METSWHAASAGDSLFVWHRIVGDCRPAHRFARAFPAYWALMRTVGCLQGVPQLSSSDGAEVVLLGEVSQILTLAQSKAEARDVQGRVIAGREAITRLMYILGVRGPH